MNLFAGIPGSQNPDGMTAASSALGAALLMADGAMKQGAAQDIGEVGEALKDLLDFGRSVMLHY